jgi:hypothetical protein
MFNINYFESFALHNGLPLGRPLSGIFPDAAEPPAASASPQDSSPRENSALPDRGSFPENALPSVIRQYARDLAEVHRVPLELPALSMIGALSGCLGKRWECVNASPGWVTRGNFYMILSLPPGSGKSVANQIVQPILSVERDRTERWNREQPSERPP